MTIVAFLPVLILVLGLVIYFVCVGLTKSSVAEVAKVMIFCGLLAFLIGSGAQSCSMGVAGGGGAAAQHR